MVLAVALVAGCSDPVRSLEDQLDGMAAVDLSHAGDAEAVVETTLGMPAGSARVRWVVGVMPQASAGETINGAAIDCDVWVSWFGSRWTSGASSDGPAISFTAFAHEMAHCALWLQGDADAGHSRPGWWEPDGRVEQANAALSMSGL